MWWDGSSNTITHYLCLSLKKNTNLKKMRKKCSIWQLLTLKNYSQWIVVFSRQCSKYLISTADRHSNKYHFQWKLSFQHPQTSVCCWHSIFQLPTHLPRQISISPTWNLQIYMQITFFPISYLLRGKIKISDIYLEFSSLVKWEKKAHWDCLQERWTFSVASRRLLHFIFCMN